MPKPAGNAFIELQRAAAAAYENKQYPLALKHIRKADKLSPRNPFVLNLLGVILRDSGKTIEARRALQLAIQLKSDFFAPYHNLAGIDYQAQDYGTAARNLQTCVRLNPQFYQAWLDLGEALRKLKDFSAARAAFQQAAQLNPNDWHPWYNMGLTCEAEENWSEAVKAYAYAHTLAPLEPKALLFLAIAHGKAGQADSSELLLEKGHRLHPQHAEILFNLSVAQREQNKTAAELQTLLKLTQLHPDYYLGHYNLGVYYQKCDQLALAAQNFERCLQLQPDHADSKLNLAAVLADLGRAEEARVLYQSLLQHPEKGAGAGSTFGSLLHKLGHYEESERIFRETIQRFPEHPDTYWNFGNLLVGLGRLKEGWPLYHYRHVPAVHRQIYNLPDDSLVRYSNMALPAWQGQDPKGKKILVWREQGIGDELLFASVLPDLVKTGAQVTFLCSPRYVEVFSRSFPSIHIIPDPYIEQAPTGRETYPTMDYHCAIGDLCTYLRPHLDNFPGASYIRPDEEKVLKYSEWLNSLGQGPKIGICWRSGKYNAERARRHFYNNLIEWAPILQSAKAVFVNLLYGDTSEEIQQVERELAVTIHTPTQFDLKNDFDDIFALMRALDLVVSAQSSVIDFAGAVGTPTLAWLPKCCIYYCMQRPGRSHWYDSVRIIDHDWFQSWAPTMRTTAIETQKLLKIKHENCNTNSDKGTLQHTSAQ